MVGFVLLLLLLGAGFGWGEEVAAELGGGDFWGGARGVVPGLSLGAGCGAWGGCCCGWSGVGGCLLALAVWCSLDAVVFVEDVAVQDCIWVGCRSSCRLGLER